MLQNPDVYFTGRSFSEDEVRDKIVVVIDVLRAGSTIVTAIKNGARGIIAVEDMSDASKIAQNLDSASYLLCGERDGEKIEGYHLGNSPFEFKPNVVAKKTLILNTTNGTRAIDRCKGADRILIGCFLNISALVEELKKETKEIVIVCSGWKNRLSFEDILCAGNILYKLNNGKLHEDAPDGARVSFALYETYGNDISTAIGTSNHAERLKKLDFNQDIEYCSQVDSTQIIPEMFDGILK
jgi:2-phosphosulfolactate phosphatase